MTRVNLLRDGPGSLQPAGTRLAAEGYEKAGRFEMALALHHQSTAGNPEDWPTTKKICELLVRMNRVEEAAAECGSFAEICAAQGQFRKAVGAWKYAASLKPSALDPYLRIGDLYARQGYKPEAKGLYALVVDECIKLGKLAEAADALLGLTRFRGHPRRGVYGCHGEAEASGVHA